MADGAQNNLLVARSLASSVKTLLGPHHSLKCCTSDGDSVICSSASKLLQFIDIQHPAGFIINDACQGQYKKYQTNCKTLICMAGFWSKAAQDLQDQGVPVPVIVRHFDDALEACEEVCQELSFPVTEALLRHHNSFPPAKNCDIMIADKKVKSSSMVYSCLGSVGKDEGDEDNADDDDNDDISWYFDGHIPGADGHIPGTGDLTPGVLGHIPGIDGHIPGIINQEATDESYFPMTLLQSVLPEVSRNRCETSIKKKDEDMLSGAKYDKLVDGLCDANVHVRQVASSVYTESPDTFQKTMNKCVFSVKQEHGKKSSSSCGTIFAKPTSNSSELMEYTSETLSSGRVDENEEEDEFEASFLEADSNSTKEYLQSCPRGFPLKNASGTKFEIIGSEITKLSVTENPKDNFLSVAGAKLITADTCEKQNKTKVHAELKSSTTADKKLTNSKGLPSSGCTKKEITDKLLFDLSEKLDKKNKGAGKQVKLSEMYRGSRHFMNSSMEATISTPPSSKITSTNKQNQTTTISPDYLRTDEVHVTSKAGIQSSRKTGQTGVSNLEHSTLLKETLSVEKPETCSAGKTSVQSTTKTSQAGKPDLVHKTLPRETLPTKNTDNLATVLHAKDGLKLMDRNRQLLSHLGDRLSHGKQQEMKLAMEVINSLFRSSGKASIEEFEIHLNMIHTELILGPPSSLSQTVDGLLLEIAATFEFSAIESGSQFFIALVNGDITSEFRHTGLNNELQIHRIIKNKEDFKESTFNQDKSWHQRVVNSLSYQNIGVLFAKGIIQESIIDYCLSHNIVVLQNVAYPTLQLLSFATGSALVTYLADLREQDVGQPVTIETWQLGWAPSVVRLHKAKAGNSRDVREMKRCQYVLVKEVNRGNISCEDSNSPLQTVLLCSPCKDLICEAEQRFWNSVHRLKNTLACGRVLPGAGAIELACIRRLNELSGEQSEPKMTINPLSGWLQDSLELFRPLVYTAFAQGFKEYLGNVLYNSGTLTTPYGISTYLEQLINTGFCLDFLGSSQGEMSADNRNELEIDTGSTLGRSRTRVANVSTRDPAKNSTCGFDDTINSAKMSRGAESLVWDDYTAKKEAWKRAVGVVRILLQSDMLVETGLAWNSVRADLF